MLLIYHPNRNNQTIYCCSGKKFEKKSSDNIKNDKSFKTSFTSFGKFEDIGIGETTTLHFRVFLYSKIHNPGYFVKTFRKRFYPTKYQLKFGLAGFNYQPILLATRHKIFNLSFCKKNCLLHQSTSLYFNRFFFLSSFEKCSVCGCALLIVCIHLVFIYVIKVESVGIDVCPQACADRLDLKQEVNECNNSKMPVSEIVAAIML